MKKQSMLRIATQLASAAVLSIFISQTSTISSVSPCIHTAGCIDSSHLTGTTTIQRWGYPAPYHTVSSFEPTNQRHYAITSLDVDGIGLGSALTILIDIVFWYALFEVVSGRVMPMIRRKKQSIYQTHQLS